MVAVLVDRITRQIIDAIDIAAVAAVPCADAEAEHVVDEWSAEGSAGFIGRRATLRRGEFGFCVDTDEELRATIEKLAANPQRCRMLGERARSVASARFTPDQYVQRLRGLLDGEKGRTGVETDGSLSAYRH